MGLWASLFVLSTLLINAPTVPAVLRFTGLAKARLLQAAASGAATQLLVLQCAAAAPARQAVQAGGALHAGK